MSDIIQLLPDSVANQIAAGEVVQRPASAVKELMENALDAGSTSIKLIVKDAGKTLIQIIDNGCGMSETDARMSFERHATSKIRKAEDFFAIRTMGFRGEALASIAAIAQVELKTRRIGDDVGVKIDIEGSELKSQEACSCPEGTSISVKNLFYNVPARRNFLKTDTVELRHIIDEFQRVAIPNPHVAFTLHHNNTEIFNLPIGNLKQRLMAVFGNSYNNRLVPVEGTPLQDNQIVPIDEVLRMIATARIIMPKSVVRLSAGRNEMSISDQALCFMAGANSIFAGEKLLTTPNPDIDTDMQMFKMLGLTPRKPFKEKHHHSITETVS